jgi:hypothetical protein
MIVGLATEIPCNPNIKSLIHSTVSFRGEKPMSFVIASLLLRMQSLQCSELEVSLPVRN